MTDEKIKITRIRYKVEPTRAGYQVIRYVGGSGHGLVIAEYEDGGYADMVAAVLNAARPYERPS